MPKEWFILQFKPNSHHKAVKNLKKQGFETFLPLYDITSRKASRFVNTTRPLFLGYMFVTFDQKNTHWSKINNTYGVSRLVTFGSILRPVPNTFIDGLMQRCDSSGKLLPAIQFKEGDEVKVSNGPFTNFIATVESLEADQRIWVLTDLMGRKAKVETRPNDLKLIN
jgi:transcriptional antiterminator RfaH